MFGIPVGPYLRLVHDYASDAPLNMRAVWVFDHALHYFVSGSGYYELGGRRHKIVPGALFSVQPGEPFSIVTSHGYGFRMLNIHFDPVKQPGSEALLWPYPQEGPTLRSPISPPSSDYLTEPAGLPANICHIAPAAGYLQRFTRLRFWHDAARGGGQQSALLESTAAFYHLLACIPSQPAVVTAGTGGEIQEALTRALDFMQQNYGRQLTLPQLAAAAGLSPSYFGATFRKYFGCSPMRYLARLRLERARDDLLFSQRPIKAIAVSAGFQTVSHFTRAFHQHYQFPPGAYRRSGS